MSITCVNEYAVSCGLSAFTKLNTKVKCIVNMQIKLTFVGLNIHVLVKFPKLWFIPYSSSLLWYVQHNVITLTSEMHKTMPISEPFCL